MAHLIDFLNKWCQVNPQKNPQTLNCSSIHPANLIRHACSRNKLWFCQYYEVHKYLEYNSVCPLVRIGTRPPPLQREPKGVGTTRLRVRRWGVPIQTTGEKAYYSAYSVANTNGFVNVHILNRQSRSKRWHGKKNVKTSPITLAVTTETENYMFKLKIILDRLSSRLMLNNIVSFATHLIFPYYLPLIKSFVTMIKDIWSALTPSFPLLRTLHFPSC